MIGSSSLLKHGDWLPRSLYFKLFSLRMLLLNEIVPLNEKYFVLFLGMLSLDYKYVENNVHDAGRSN